MGNYITLENAQLSILLTHKGLDPLMKRDATSKIPPDKRYWLGRIHEKAISLHKSFMRQINAVGEAYAEVDSNGSPKRAENGGYIIDKTKHVEANSQIQILNEQLIEFPGIYWFEVTPEEMQKWGLSGYEMSFLSILIKEESDENQEQGNQECSV